MSTGSAAPPPRPYGEVSGGVAPSPARSSRRSRWIIVGVAIAVVVLFLLLFGLLATVVFRALKSSEPYQHSVQSAVHDSRVIAELGSPVQPGWLVSGSIHLAGPSGNADLSIPLQGSRLHGTLYVVAKKSAGRWTYQTLELRAEGQPDLDLRQPAPAAPSTR